MSGLSLSSASERAARRSNMRGRHVAVWLTFAAASLCLPLLLRSGTSLTVMSLMGIAIVFALSYNILLGQTGLLSFGHAVYYGLGAYFTVHAINAIRASGLSIPLPLLPIVGGLAGLAFAMVFGWVSTKRSGTAFAMISLGLAELVGSSSLILRSFFGGEAGISANRARLLPFFGWSFGPQLQVYYLIAFWCLISAAAMYALTRTPFGRLCNAVRENPERVAFIGYNPQTIRYMAFCFAGFFGGIAGGLAGINFELANSALFSATQSGLVLLATFIGGAGYFLGPVLGATLVTYLQTMLSDYTDAWQLYFGLLFIATVMFSPGGLTHAFMIHDPLWRAGRVWKLLPSYVLLFLALAIFLPGIALAIEMTNHVMTKAAQGPVMTLAGFGIDTGDWHAWTFSLAAIAAGAAALRFATSRVFSAWERATGREPGGLLS
jgi:branched-chain amino acid transport system permease protein